MPSAEALRPVYAAVAACGGGPVRLAAIFQAGIGTAGKLE